MNDGDKVGIDEGYKLGELVGVDEGMMDGFAVGVFDGIVLGVQVGTIVGDVGTAEGEHDGGDEEIATRLASFDPT
jgi:hypothetical protein